MKRTLWSIGTSTCAALILSSCGGAALQVRDADWNAGWSYWSDKSPEHVTVDLPHDAMIVGERDPEVVGGQASAFFGGDVYHYEKTLHVSQQMAKSHVTLQFEGVYRNPQVYINDQLAGGTAYGYLPFGVTADGLLHEGDNVIRIDADNSHWPNTRWYSGGGIYRPIHLLVQDPEAYIEQVKVLTTSYKPAVISLSIAHQGGEVHTTILLDGKPVATAEGDKAELTIADARLWSAELTIADARLWSAESPTLYEARVELSKGGKVVETRSERFGIRKVEWNGQQGLLVNGQPTLLKGGCLHHDEGILGAREYDDAARRKVARMKEYGFNAIRSAHNPTSPAMLRACDELGMYVMDEMWDMWYSYKNQEDYSKDFMDHWQGDIDAICARDYNHPSVILYSIGNEVVEPATKEGLEMEQQLVAHFHEMDPSRPVTCGMNLVIQMMNVAMGMNLVRSDSNGQQGTGTTMQKMTSEEYNKMVVENGQRMAQGVVRPEIDMLCAPGLDMLDIAGYNYAILRADLDAQLHPDRVQVGTETYTFDLARNWAIVERLPQLVGDFMWTGWDHLGEVGIGQWYYSDEDEPAFYKQYPWLISGAGALDLLGNPTGEALRAQAVWSKDDAPHIGVCPVTDQHLVKAMWRGSNSIPCWSWPGMEGKTTQVEVFTTAPKVRLYVNDQLVGEQSTVDALATFSVIYQPGTLRAVTVSADGTEHSAELRSATGEARLTLQPEAGSYHVGDLIYIDVDLTGDNGEVFGNHDTQLHATVEGAELLAFGSARPFTTERFQDGTYTPWYGRALAIVRAAKPGTVTLKVSGEGLAEAACDIAVK